MLSRQTLPCPKVLRPSNYSIKARSHIGTLDTVEAGGDPPILVVRGIDATMQTCTLQVAYHVYFLTGTIVSSDR